MHSGILGQASNQSDVKRYISVVSRNLKSNDFSMNKSPTRSTVKLIKALHPTERRYRNNSNLLNTTQFPTYNNYALQSNSPNLTSTKLSPKQRIE